MYANTIPDKAEFDFFVVGAGSAGCTATNINLKIPRMAANIRNVEHRIGR